MMTPATLPWFARHEFGLFWRDWVSMMTAGKYRRKRALFVFLAIGAVLLHAIAVAVLTPVVAAGIGPTKPILVFVGGTMALSFSLMLSQSMESVTRAFYARDDLDLIMSSPALVQKLFAVRISAIAVTTTAMSLLLATPFINALAFLDGFKWLAAYPAIVAMAAFATAFSVLLTIALFRLIGPARTRFVAQVVAAVIGAAFVIGVQVVAIIYYGSLSRLDVFTSGLVINMAPDLWSAWWLPVRGLMGEPIPLAITLAVSFGSLAAVIALEAPGFGDRVLSTAGLSRRKNEQKAKNRNFTELNPAQALRHKEWVLLKRDPWLVSQSLMQILYLVPPAFLLWRNHADEVSSLVIVAPVVVMAAGQLAGGLAWLAVSGEDAPDLVATAPVSPRRIIQAKIEAVMAVIATIVLPLVVAMAFVDGWIATVGGVGVLVSSLSAICIQLWFRKQARRTHFRRRQISSRAATFAEAFSSILWAGTAGIAAAGSWFALGFAIPALIVLATARAIAPRQE